MTATLANGSAAQVVHQYLSEVVTGIGPTAAEELIGNEVLRQRVRALRSAFSDLSISVHQMVNAEDLVAIHATASGTHTGTFQGVPATGRRWNASYTAILRISDGRIADFWDNWDMLTILEQIGGVKRVDGVSA